MIDDRDEALLSTYTYYQESHQHFLVKGQLFHFAQSGIGGPPESDKWSPKTRVKQVISVGSWQEVMFLVNAMNKTYIEPAISALPPTTASQEQPSDSPSTPVDVDSPWDEWIAEIDFKAERSELNVPAMPLLENRPKNATHRLKTAASWSPFPVAVTKMMSKKEMREIPEALEAMRKEFSRLSGKFWIEKDRRSKKDVIAEAHKN